MADTICTIGTSHEATMNKPAPKEPSMDEILSSIRQIIADDDAAGAPRRPSIHAAPPPMEAAPRPMTSVAAPVPTDFSDVLDEIEPLNLSAAQIVAEDDDDDEDDPMAGLSFDAILADTASGPEPEAELVDPEDIAFDLSELDIEAPTPVVEAPVATVTPIKPAPQPEPVRPAMDAPKPTMTAPAMPDPTLSSDMADRLLEPATNAAVRGTFAKLGQMGIGAPGVTIEGMIRDMLRPMLKEWLDENLPSVVERMVEKEIARISRGE